MFYDEFQNRLILSGRLKAKTALRVGKGRALEPVGTDLPVIKDAVGKPFIPGSTFKGVLRSHVESRLRAVVGSEWGACIVINENEQCVQAGSKKPEDWEYPDDGTLPEKPIGIEDLKKGLDKLPISQRDIVLAERVRDNSCLVCRTFGSPWLASHVQISDLPVDEEMWFNQFQVRDGVAIDRDTETASEGMLYSYEVVPAGTEFEFRLLAENVNDWQLGMLFVGLDEFRRQEGQATLGGFTSRGLGRVKLEGLEARWIEQGDLLSYLEGKEVEALKDEKLKEQIKDWREAFLGKVREGKEG